MHRVRGKFRQGVARLARRNPAQLWVHYLLCVILFLILVFTTYLLNTAMIQGSVAASEGVLKSNQQAHLTRDLIQQAGALDLDDTLAVRRYSKAIQTISVNHVELTAKQDLSDALHTHLFGPPQPLDSRMREFISLALKIPDSPPQARAVVVDKLNTLYYGRALHGDLLYAAVLFAREVEERAIYHKKLKLLLLGVSLVILLLEVAFVFLPTKRAIETRIVRMKRQTKVLRLSRARLKQVNAKLEHLLHHDTLTGLPNRTYLATSLGGAITRRKASSWHVFLVGLDDFKTVNDVMGHDVGDAVLIAVSAALKDCLNYDDLVARVGGDEFVLVTDEACDSVLRRIKATFEEPFQVMGRSVPISSSIGHLPVGSDLRSPMDIVADAELALQFAKAEGGKQSQEFTPDLRKSLGMTHALQLNLQDAIRNGEIEPWFQPQIKLEDGSLHGAEVLVRWRHPTQGVLTPDKFLPAAERAGLMVELDHVVWKTAMQFAQQWAHDALWDPLIGLNAAPDTIADPHMVERFLLLLRRSGLGTSQVAIEVLETTLIDGKDDIAAINIDSLAECGIAMELDDFGTGYASLSKLTQLPLAGIKIDRSLITPLPDPAADSVLRAILTLSHELGLHVVAEGVEEAAQAEHLQKAGCGIGQGYGFGRPMPAEEFRKWLCRHALRAVDRASNSAADLRI